MSIDNLTKNGIPISRVLNEIADDNAVGKYYTTVSGYQSSGTDIGESLIENTFTIEGGQHIIGGYNSSQIIKNTGRTQVSSSSNSPMYTYIVGEQLTAISANGQYRLGARRSLNNSTSSTHLRISSDFGATWNTPSTSTYGTGFRCVAMSANGLCAISGTAVSLSGSINGNYHRMYYNHNGDWSDINKYSTTTTVWNKSTMIGTVNLKHSITYDTLTIVLDRGFRHVVLSASGQYGACTFSVSTDSTSGYVYCTSDYGVTWNEVTDINGPLVWWMSSSGQYCYGVSSSKLWRSSTYGETWEEAPESLDCNRVTASADGQYVIRYTIPDTEDYVTNTIYRSNDYGITWTSVTNLAGNDLPISKISMSANGRYVVGESLTRLIRSNDYGATWINDSTYIHSNVKGYGSCSISADGNHVINIIQYHSRSHYYNILGYTNDSTIKETKDLAEIYEPKLRYLGSAEIQTDSFNSIGVSGNGEYILHGSIYIKLSNDRGNTWSSVTGLGTHRLSGRVSISYDGKYILVGISNPPRVTTNKVCGLSTDYGGTWQIYDSTSQFMGNIVGMNSDGKYMYCGLRNSYNGYGTLPIKRSNDYGASWSSIDGLKETNGQWINPTQIAISATGKYGIVVGQGCDIYKTSDYGENWVSCGIGNRYRMGAAISKNGKYCAAIEGSLSDNGASGIIHSSDYGVTWSSSTIPSTQLFVLMSMSDSGQYVAAISADTHLYISTDFGVSFVSHTISGSLRECAMTGKGDIIWTASTTKIQKHTMV